MGYRLQVGSAEDTILQAVISHYDPTHPTTSYGWASSAPSVATVTAIGDGLTATLHAVAAGSTNITLTINRFGASAITQVIPVQVTPANTATAGIITMSPLSQSAPNDPAGPGGGGQIPSPGNMHE